MMSLLPLLFVQSIQLEAEDALMEGPQVATTRSGFSGKGYATGFTTDKARLTWKVPAKAGIYQAVIVYAADGPKGFDLAINGRRSSGMFAVNPTFSRHIAGKVELKDGPNEISIERGWGYYDIDRLELQPAKAAPPPKPVPVRLTNPDASVEARQLFARLAANYGKRTLSGQFDLKEANYVRQKTGQMPAILGSDFMDYSPSRVERSAGPPKLTESLIDAAKKGQIVTITWHWNAPTDLIDNENHVDENGRKVNAIWWRGFYTNASRFDVAKALADPSSDRYKLIIRDIDAIAVELKKLQAAKVPVLWRPLHEAEGGWFWWGAKGPEPCKQLWRLLRERLEKHHRIDNLIWVWNSADPAWYPGDETVDVMSIDSYPSDRGDALSGSWESLLQRFDGKKMLGLAEFPGAPDVDRMYRFGVRWSFFVSWTGSVGPSSTPPDVLRRVYNSNKVLNRKGK